MMNKDYIASKLFIGWMVIILILICFGHCSEKTATSKIQKIINTHNSVKESDKSYPLLRKSPSSQKTVMYGDSIRIYNPTESQKEIDSINDYMRHWYEVCDTNSDGDIDEVRIKL